MVATGVAARGRDDAEVVVVGSGMAGSVFAAILAEAGRTVTMLEAGAPRALSDLYSSQLWARRLKWSGAPVLHEGNHQFGHNLNTGWGQGGAAIHHYATWPRMHEDVFRLRSEYGRGLDWPIGYDDLREHYDRVQAYVGLSGDAEAESWRPPSAPYDLPPMEVFGQGRAIARGFEAMGLPLAPYPAAILTEQRGSRAPCIYDGWCDAGCPIGSLANPLVTYQERALAAGAKLVTDRRVTRVLTEGDRATGVEWSTSACEPGRTDGQVVVLATSAIQNPRILLASPDPRTGRAVGDRGDALGRYFCLDSLALAYGLFEDETEPHRGVSAGQMMHRAVHDDGSDRPFGGYQWQVAPAMKPNDIFGVAMSRPDLFGAPLDAFLRDATRHLGSMVAMIEETARWENRIELATETDACGMPLARVFHSFDEEALALWSYVNDQGRAVMKAAGAREHWSGLMGAGHLIGGTVMGEAPETSVTDGCGRVHDTANLLLGGSGLFPASGGVSPTFTLTALAERSARQVAEHWGTYAA